MSSISSCGGLAKLAGFMLEAMTSISNDGICVHIQNQMLSYIIDCLINVVKLLYPNDSCKITLVLCLITGKR